MAYFPMDREMANLLMLWMCMYIVNGECPPSSHFTIATFGSKCEHRCHCINDEQCDNETGHCSKGCAHGWMGIGCQYRNVAKDYKTVKLSDSDNTTEASQIVDGHHSSCIKPTNDASKGHRWWQIQLKRPFYINGLIITVPLNYKRTLIFELNSTTNATPKCNESGDAQHGKLIVMCNEANFFDIVRIRPRNENVTLSLCEVEIYGGREVAFNKYTNQVNTYEGWTSNKAVDGRALIETDPRSYAEKTCSATASNVNSWWSVSLNATFLVQDIHVYGRFTNVGQTANFSILIENGTNNGTEVFKDDGKSTNYQKTTSLDNVYTGNNVTISKPNSDVLALCEVLVFAECPKGTCGWDCSKVCHCKNDITGDFKINGTCPDGCNANWTGESLKCDRVSVCNPYRWGSQCQHECGKCSRNTTCNEVDGSCIEGCSGHREPPLCVQACKASNWGKNCAKHCGNCKDNKQCDPSNGTCLHGCNPGWRTAECTSACDIGYWGVNCSKKCGNCNSNATCNATNGVCTRGCDLGWTGADCSTECENGHWGVNCSNNCGNCKDKKTCNATNGICIDGCSSGWTGENCTNECDSGYWGMNCSTKCGHCIYNDTCIASNGICVNGCRPGWTDQHCSQVLKLQGTHHQAVFAVSSASGCLVFLVLAIAGIIVYKHRTRTRKPLESEDTNYVSEQTNDKDAKFEKSEVVQNDSFKVDAIYDNVLQQNDCCHIPIYVHYLREYCRKARSEPSFLFQEFAQLPYGLQYDTTEATKVANKAKNRYKNMYPYDFNRVHLLVIEDQPNSDYINASYIDGYNTKQKYIAAQGVIETSMTDFWRMIWYSKVCTIVMLTKCFEDAKMKSKQYWPDRGSILYGGISVETMVTEEYADFVIHKFRCMLESTGESHQVTHFYYTAWPDNGIPDNPISIAQFWQRIRFGEVGNKHPWLVHCSAGIGRTGTFIALDYLYDAGKQNGIVDIFDGVNTLRKQRVNMVQTKEQYVFLHCVLAEVLDEVGFRCKTTEYDSVIRDKYSNKDATTNNKLMGEFLDLSYDADDHEEAADALYGNLSSKQCKSGIDTSRNPDVALGDAKPSIQSTTDQGSNYFNSSVFISTHRFKCKLIMAPIPMAHSAVGFVRMLFDLNISTVVLLEDKVTQEYEYWTSDNRNSNQIGQYGLELISETKCENWIIRKLEFTHTGKTESKTVNLIQFMSWPDRENVPTSTDCMLRLFAFIEKFSEFGDQKAPILVQCINGKKKSGLFCVVWSILERIMLDGEVAIADTVRLSRFHCRNIIDNVEEYKYCYDIAQDYLDSFDHDSNI